MENPDIVRKGELLDLNVFLGDVSGSTVLVF